MRSRVPPHAQSAVLCGVLLWGSGIPGRGPARARACVLCERACVCVRARARRARQRQGKAGGGDPRLLEIVGESSVCAFENSNGS